MAAAVSDLMPEPYANEEEVKIKFLLPWLEELGYKQDCMSFEQTIKVSEGRKEKSIFADVVVYADKKKDTPLIVIDTKGPKEVLRRADREQVISYARLLPKIAPLAVLTNGSTVQVYQTIDKSRIETLPPRRKLFKDFVSTVISATVRDALQREARHTLFTIDDVGAFRELLKRCHNEIRNNEGYDPVQAFDELSKVLFAKMYEEKYHAESNRFTLDTFNDALEKLKVNIVQQQFQEIVQTPEYSGLFSPGATIKLQDRTIRTIVGVFEKYDLTLTAFDVKGEAFEYFLGDTFTGGLGEFFTPRNVVEFMVEAVSPKIGDRIVDPFCGTGGFLIYAFDVVSNKIKLNEFSDEQKAGWQFRLSTESLFGTDWKDRTAQACKMNMVVHGDGHTGIFKQSGFEDVPGKIEDGAFSICLTNPPFGAMENDPEVLGRFELGKGRRSQQREILALERCIRLVKPGGLIGIVMIDGVLNNDSLTYVREYVRRQTNVLAIVSMIEDTFSGYGSRAKTSILILRKKSAPAEPTPDRVFLAVCTNSGYSPSGAEIPGNQLPDILFDYRTNYPKGENTFVFPQSFVAIIGDGGARLDAEFHSRFATQNALPSPLSVRTQLCGDMKSLVGMADALTQSLASLSTTTGFTRRPLSTLVRQVRDLVILLPNEPYSMLGVRWWGEGVFLREEKRGQDIKTKAVNRVHTGQLIYNRLFAWKGSFAQVPPELDGRFVSSEFPTFEPLEGPVTGLVIEYLAFYLTSPAALALVERLSTGSTKVSRRRLKEAEFLKLSVPVPDDPQRLEDIVGVIRELRLLQAKVKGVARSLRSEDGQVPLALKMLLPTIEETN